jgi:adenylate cyclase
MPRRRLSAGLLIGVAATLLGVLVGHLPFFETVEWKLYDLRVRAAADPAAADPTIALVHIDERSIRHLAPVVGRWPWPRGVHGAVVDFLARAPARVVVYDVLFTEPDRSAGIDLGGHVVTGAESDADFAASVSRAGTVVLAADATFEGLDAPALGPDGDEGRGALEAVRRVVPPTAYRINGAVERRPSLAEPYPALARAARSLGHNYFVLDPDGPVRRAVPFVRVGDEVVPSLALSALIATEGLSPDEVGATDSELTLGRRRLPLVVDRLPTFGTEGAPEHASRLLIDFRGPAVLDDGRATTYRSYSFYDLFYSEQQLLEGITPNIDPSEFRDQLVVVGIRAAGLHDVFTVPFGGGGKMPGNQVHASILDQLRAARSIAPLSWLSRAALAAVLAVAAALLMTARSVRVGGVGTVLLVAATVVASFWAFTRGIWTPVVEPVLAMAFAGVGGLAYQYLVEGREKRQVKRLFSHYLSHDVYEQVLLNPSLAELGGTRREMSVLFSDIRGFTALTESGQAEALVAQLNEYFSRMVEVVFAHRGTLDKFVGDMVMALFGAPLDDEEHADHAVEAALEMVAALDDLNRKWAAEGRPTLGIGIGVNSGGMIAGNIGSERVRSYTVIGDHVNLAARLESLNKEHGTAILISEWTAARLKRQYDLRPLGAVVVRGKSVPVQIYEVRPPAPRAGPGPQEGFQR